MRPHHLDLAQRDAAGELAKILAEGHLQHQRLALAEPADQLQPLGPEPHLPQRLDICGHPGIAMGCELPRLQQRRIDRPAGREIRQQPTLGRREQALGGVERATGERQQIREERT